jgi:BirA family biotin operon repressor/biotin-[acetyl-CoA-carboxylase] ligase
MDWNIRHKAVTESTNKDALGGMPGDVFVADMQTAGRGRLDHKWLSAPGENLMMSAVVDVSRIDPCEKATLPLVAGLSAAQAVGALGSEASGALGGVKVKWPNDVLVGKRKICGILCELNGDNVIIGIGLNVNQQIFPPEISSRATSLRIETGKEMRLAEVRDALLDRLAANIMRWRAEGFAALLPELSVFDGLKGEYVAVRRTDDDLSPAEGICGGIRPDGTLDIAGEAISAGEAHILLR